MNEELISFDTAVLAKQKGFNLKQWCYYLNNGKFQFLNLEESDGVLNSELEDGYTVPSQNILQKWLREVHKIHIIVKPMYSCRTLEFIGYEAYLMFKTHENSIFLKELYKKFEEALEEGLKQALKLIKV